MTRLPSDALASPALLPATSTSTEHLRKCRGRSSTTPALNVASSREVADVEDLNVAGLRFTEKDAEQITLKLLDWYDTHHRVLPWRQDDLPTQSSCDSSGKKDTTNYQLVDQHGEQQSGQLQQQRAYATWVSEVMLQQTRVAKVIHYFNRWMEKWPTVHDLAGASEEEVNALWAGLGYYRRARFLLEGAKQIVQLQGGLLPSSEVELRKIPGIGKYTAGAIASIAFNQPVPVVDGNVIRVLCRLKAISANPKASSTLKTLWLLAGQLVDKKRPGDLNQALMELGAIQCLSSTPNCASCPIQDNCEAYTLSQVARGSASSALVKDFPVKVSKSAPRREYVAVCVLERTGTTAINLPRTRPDGSFLLVKRPQTGLLAGLWEFPSASLAGPNSSLKMRKAAVDAYLKGLLGFQLHHIIKARETVGTHVHVFTHIRLHMEVEWIQIIDKDVSLEAQDLEVNGIKMRWVHANAIHDVGLTSGVRKVYEMFLESRHAGSDFISKSLQRKRKKT